ncbi:hypothetical protein JK208_07695 [Gluconobacter sp. Dm-74]|uniref:hypothetical protein n=1 Tax=Gluconobacter sp. Dm-74 TaxID=2799803 RepID=UPI001B8CE584|nr:hypothetical protein [Gluconobacter sp. Dm-74]MBS1091491.1 hypothetical protein [Gluconobacter sp. Dm-74]
MSGSFLVGLSGMVDVLALRAWRVTPESQSRATRARARMAAMPSHQALPTSAR